MAKGGQETATTTTGMIEAEEESRSTKSRFE
jgi:hypothetical protein